MGAAHLFNHIITPALFVADWYLNDKKGIFEKSDIFRWMLYPAFYYFMVMLLGSMNNYYPYFFLDAHQLGYPLVSALAILGMGIFFLICIGYYKLDIKFSQSKRT